MKKFTILSMLILFVYFGFSQSIEKSNSEENAVSLHSVEYVPAADVKLNFKESKLGSDSKSVVWSMDFNGGIDWEFGNLDQNSQKSWEVTDNETAFGSGGINRNFGSFENFRSYWDNNTKYAWVDIAADIPSNGGRGNTSTEPYIIFKGINLSDITTAKIRFNHLFKRLNSADIFIDWSDNEGTTWITQEIHKNLPSNSLTIETFETLLSGANIGDPGPGGCPNLWLRLRWKTTVRNSSGEYGYFWFVDDIEIFESTTFDVSLEDYRVNFFEYKDYHTAPYFLEGLDLNLHFHTSNHIGQFPKSFVADGNAKMAFNGIIKNVGAETVTPGLDVKVFKEGNESAPIYHQTINAVNQTYPNRIGDTIDIWQENEFTIPSDIEVGKYIVRFEAMVNHNGSPVEDQKMQDNVKEAYFYVTNNTYSYDSKSITEYMGPAVYVDGQENGSLLDVDFNFITQEQLKSCDIFISSLSDAETGINVEFYTYEENGGEWDYMLKYYEFVDIEEENRGNWINIEFPQPINVGPNTHDDESPFMVLIGFTYYTHDLYIGGDITNKLSCNHIYYRFPDNLNLQLVGPKPAPALRLRTVADVEDPVPVASPLVSQFIPDNMSTNHALDLEVAVRFNKAVEQGTNWSNITMTDENNNPISITVTIDPTQPDLVIIDHDDLDYETWYTVTIPRDALENLDRNIAWRFQTKADIGAPIIKNNGINIYPNPTSGLVKIQNAGGATIEILNYMGQVIEKINNANELQEINISNLSAGNYFVRIVIDGEVSVDKISLIK